MIDYILNMTGDILHHELGLTLCQYIQTRDTYIYFLKDGQRRILPWQISYFCIEFDP